MNEGALEQDRDRMPRPGDEDEEDEDEDEGDEEEIVEENDGLYDGGVAEPIDRPEERRSAVEADIVSLITTPCAIPWVNLISCV